MSDIFSELRKPFPPDGIEWRVGQAGTFGENKVWAKVLAYLTARAVMDRLDAVVGPEHWRNEYTKAPHDPKGESLLCTLYIRIAGEWIGKTDGASASEVEATKGGISDSLKRAAVCWGIGRYLYDLGESFAVDCTTTKPTGSDKAEYHYQPKSEKKNVPAFYWKAPHLPAWALPEGKPPPSAPPPKTEPKPKEPELTDAQRTYVADASQQIANCVTMEDKVEAEAVMESIAAFIRDKDMPVKKSIGALWLTSMKMINPDWKKPEAAK